MRGERLLAVSLVIVAATGRASAHPVGGTRFDAPVPLWIVLVGAGVTVALTAVVLTRVGEPAPRTRRLVTLPTAAVGVASRVAAVAFLLAVVAAIADGISGPQRPLSNVATLFVWALWLKGVALVAVTAGSPWRALSPWRTVYRGLCAVEGATIRLRAYPAPLGSWPALLGVVVLLGVVDNLTVIPRSPAGTARLVAAYFAVMVLGGLVFGRQWFARADPLEVFYRLLGRTAPLSLERDGDRAHLVGRTPWVETARPVADGALVAVVVAAVYTVSFDGFAVTAAYQSLQFGARAATGLGPEVGVALYVLGFGGFLLAFWAVARLVGRLGGIARPALAIAPTVLPIAAAYEVAHNYPFVLTTLGRVPTTVGLAAVEPLAWLSLPAFWASQVLLIVGGHVVAVVAAHRVVAAGGRAPLRAHAPLVVLMVGYTVLSLWIVSRPVVT